MAELVSYLTEVDFRKSVYRNVVQIIVKAVWDIYWSMNRDPHAHYAASHSSHYGGDSGIGGSLVLALVLAGVLAVLSYPIVTLAVVAGAVAPLAVRKVRAGLRTTRTESSGTPVRARRRSRREPSD